MIAAMRTVEEEGATRWANIDLRVKVYYYSIYVRATSSLARRTRHARKTRHGPDRRPDGSKKTRPLPPFRRTPDRPAPIKTHKTLAIAHQQMRRGPSITCQLGGPGDIDGRVDRDMLIPQHHRRRQAGSTGPSAGLPAHRPQTRRAVEGLPQPPAGATVGVVVELGVGGRAGVPTPQAALELAQQIGRSPGLELRGLMAFPTSAQTRPVLQETLALLDKSGLPHPIVSGGSTASALLAHEVPELTEHRAGEYCVGGVGHLRRGTHTVAQCALRVLMTVVSRPTPERAILDGGSKSLSASTIQDGDHTSMGYIVEYPQARFSGASEEHGHVDVSACNPKPQLGERVRCCPSIPALH